MAESHASRGVSCAQVVSVCTLWKTLIYMCATLAALGECENHTRHGFVGRLSFIALTQYVWCRCSSASAESLWPRMQQQSRYAHRSLGDEYRQSLPMGPRVATRPTAHLQAAIDKEGCGAHFFKFQFNFWWIVMPAAVVVVCWRRIAAAFPGRH